MAPKQEKRKRKAQKRASQGEISSPSSTDPDGVTIPLSESNIASASSAPVSQLNAPGRRRPGRDHRSRGRRSSLAGAASPPGDRRDVEVASSARNFAEEAARTAVPDDTGSITLKRIQSQPSEEKYSSSMTAGKAPCRSRRKSSGGTQQKSVAKSSQREELLAAPRSAASPGRSISTTAAAHGRAAPPKPITDHAAPQTRPSQIRAEDHGSTSFEKLAHSSSKRVPSEKQVTPSRRASSGGAGRPPSYSSSVARSRSASRSHQTLLSERSLPRDKASTLVPTMESPSTALGKIERLSLLASSPRTQDSRKGDDDRVYSLIMNHASTRDSASPLSPDRWSSRRTSRLPTPDKARTGQESPAVPPMRTAPEISEAREKMPATPQRKRSKTSLSRRGSLREGAFMSEHQNYSPVIVGCSALVVASFCVVVVVVLLLTSPDKRGRVACESAACVELNDMLKSSVNASVQPCVNFYKYVCGPPFAGDHTSVYRQLVERFGRALISFANDDFVVSAIGQTPVQKVALFLRTCLLANTYTDEQTELAKFRGKLMEIGVVWPNFSQAPNVIGTAAKVYATFRVAPLLDIKRSRVGEEGDPYASVGPGTVLPTWKEKRDRMRLSKTYEVFYADTVAFYAGQSSRPSRSEFKKFEDLESVVLEKLVYNGRSRADYVHHLHTVSSLETFTPNVKAGVWQALVTNDLGLATSAEVRVRNPEYLKRFNDVLGEVPEQDLHFYLDWCVLQAMGRFISASLSNLWYTGSATARDPTASGDPSFSTPNAADCLQLTESLLGWSLFQHFAVAKLNQSVMNSVKVMADIIGTGLVRRLEVAPWLSQMDPPHSVEVLVTKADFEDVLNQSSRFSVPGALAAALANVSDMHNSSFFTNWVNAAATTARLPKSTWDQVSTSYIADIRNNDHFVAFDPARQSVRLPPYFAMVPVFHRDVTDSANYGGLGAILGAASIHLLVSRLSRNESLAPLLAEAGRRLDCYAKPAAENATAFPRERVYLAASLPAVWETYHNRKLLGVGDHRGLRDFSSEKSFFVTMCYLLCDGRDDPEAAEFACNAAVKNIKAFSVAYHCERDSPMHPRHKCQLFK
ncbi:endothelin-converting enzyme 1-like [Dermacentor albipictus]|uniref:endothelin-converting enzyme 1-like n=1 Tax=Dermacentor albipictus TaxID=60249 RepID=UPI0031FD4CE9